MSYPEFQDDLQSIHNSEVYGLAVFGTAARVSIRSASREKWQTLKRLEEQTLERYFDYMRESQQETRGTGLWHLKGVLEGVALGLMPWSIAMRLLRNGTQPFQQTFRRLTENADGAHQDFFTYVYAHEKAIESFACRELAGEPDSLNEVLTLLAD